MQSDRTFEQESPDFTVRHLVIFIIVSTLVVGALGRMWLNDGSMGVAIMQILTSAYLYFVRKVTFRALTIAVMAIGAADGFFMSVDSICDLLDSGKIKPLGMVAGCVIAVTAAIAVSMQVESLPKRWDTLVRHIYPK